AGINWRDDEIWWAVEWANIITGNVTFMAVASALGSKRHQDEKYRRLAQVLHNRPWLRAKYHIPMKAKFVRPAKAATGSFSAFDWLNEQLEARRSLEAQESS
ncbi:MAG TPA: hypothetical protein VI483_00690, partial [Candidatus Paceibacterota bacterium]